MTAYILAAMIAVAPMPSAHKRAEVVRTYHSLLAHHEIERHRIAALPINEQFARIDASDRIRSISFGHTTTLLVPSGVTGHPRNPDRARVFYVEYGPSTNAPGAIFGPFAIQR
jgi:hypothetical protein